MKFRSFIIASVLILAGNVLMAQVQLSQQPHQSKIECMEFYGDDFYTGGDDGFIVKWLSDGNGEHFQVSDMKIKMMAIHPNGYEIAIYETDEFAIHRISVWNWKTKTRKFAKRFTDSITCLSYTAKGSYLMAGTTSVDGLLFLDINKGTPLSVLQANTGIVNLAKTGKKESTMLTYEEQGKIKYYSLTDGNMIREFKCESQLENPILVHNNRFLVGTKNNKIYIVDATDGITKKIHQSDKTSLFCANDDELYYSENNSENYSLCLKKLELNKGDNRFESTLIKNFDFGSSQSVSKAIVLNSIAYFGTTIGDIFSMGIESMEETVSALRYTEMPDYKITDIIIIDNDYFIAVNGKILSGTIMNQSLIKICETDNQNITATPEKDLILWTKGAGAEICILKKTDSGYEESYKTIYTPTMPINSLSVWGDKILIVEGNSNVIVHDLVSESTTQLYSGTGLQDAVLVDSNMIYVAKTRVTNPNSALISINMTTKETVPISINGEIMFSLTKKTPTSKIIYGISNEIKEGKKLTKIFSYATDTKKYETKIQWGDEDSTAFLKFINGMLYTNIGKTGTISLDLSNKKKSQLKRSASLPDQIAGNKMYVATLNKDGSITWYNSASNTRIETWYYTNDGYIQVR